MKVWTQIIKPTLVLIMVCAVISAALAVTYNLTGVANLGKGYSAEELKEFSANALPEADSLTQITPSFEDENLILAYKADNGTGIAVIVKGKGYNSEGITMMVGMNPEGAVQGIHIISHLETSGIGDKVANNDAEYLKNFEGNTKGNISADIVAGATRTSNGIIDGVTKATELFEKLKTEVE